MRFSSQSLKKWFLTIKNLKRTKINKFQIFIYDPFDQFNLNTSYSKMFLKYAG